MEYYCQTVPIGKMPVGPMGLIGPLCDVCRSQDCTNPIETMKISIIGEMQEHRLYVRFADPAMVVSCQGFIK